MSDRKARLATYLVPLIIGALAIPAYATVRHKRSHLVDFIVNRTAAIRAIHGEPLYRPEDGHFQWKYPPVSAFVMAPMTWISPTAGEALWFAMLVVLLVAYFRVSVEALPDRRWRTAPLIAVAAFVTAKFWIKELVLGQTNLILGVLLLSAVLAARGNRRLLSGALVAIAVIVKPYALLFVPWLAAAASVSAMVLAGTIVVVAQIAPACVYGWRGNLDQMAAWYRTVTDTTGPNLLYPENISLSTMWAKWIDPGAAAAALAASSIIVCLGVAVFVVWLGRRLNEPRYLELGFLAVLVPLLSPQGWDYVFIMALPAFICLIDRFGALSGIWRGITSIGLAFVSFTVFDLLGRALYSGLMMMSIVTVGGLLLLLALLHLRRRGLA